MELLQMLADLLFLAGYVATQHTFPEQLTPKEERDCLERCRQGDEQAREKLIVHNLRLVAHIAKKYEKAGREADDLISIGSIGLIKAVSTFDMNKGVPLSSYASRCIENEMLMSIRQERRRAHEISLNDPIGTDGDGNDIALIDLIGTDADQVADAVFSRLAADDILKAVQETLTEREQTVIRLRFGLLGGYRMPQREVAELMGISRSYISRIEKRALQKLVPVFQKKSR